MYYRRDSAHAGTLHQLRDAAAVAKAVPRYAKHAALDFSFCGAYVFEGCFGFLQTVFLSRWATLEFGPFEPCHRERERERAMTGWLIGAAFMLYGALYHPFLLCGSKASPRAALHHSSDKKLDNDDPEHMKVSTPLSVAMYVQMLFSIGTGAGRDRCRPLPRDVRPSRKQPHDTQRGFCIDLTT